MDSFPTVKSQIICDFTSRGFGELVVPRLGVPAALVFGLLDNADVRVIGVACSDVNFEVVSIAEVPGSSRAQRRKQQLKAGDGNDVRGESGPISPADKMAICLRLGISLTPNTLFEGTGRSADESFLPPEPDFRGENGRKFWVYQMDQQLPV